VGHARERAVGTLLGVCSLWRVQVACESVWGLGATRCEHAIFRASSYRGRPRNTLGGVPGGSPKR
jgi:hypothetical protein